MGCTTPPETSLDISFVNLTDQGWTGRPIIYDGSLPTDTGSIIGVDHADRTDPTAGNNVCVSGATSGSTCATSWSTGGLRHWTVHDPWSGDSTSVGGFRTDSWDGSEIIALGDSGGPVYYVIDGSTKIAAKGILSAFPGSVTCPGYVNSRPMGVTQKCGSSALIVTMSLILPSHPNAIFHGFDPP